MYFRVSRVSKSLKLVYYLVEERVKQIDTDFQTTIFVTLRNYQKLLNIKLYFEI